jgi:hypothetical protein
VTTPTRTAKRVDDQGRAFAGSQLQLQLYVNRRPGELERAIRTALRLPECTFDWRSPLERDRFKEYKDRAFLSAIGRADLSAELREFWPTSGPRWDGLAVLQMPNKEAVLLVEAKNYPAEVRGGGCKATDKVNARKRITAAFAWAAPVLGASVNDRWMGSLYQYANRLAHAAFLRRHGVDAYMVNVCFYDDPHLARRTSEQEWRKAAGDLKVEVGLVGVGPTWLGDVFLRVRPRTELLSP